MAALCWIYGRCDRTVSSPAKVGEQEIGEQCGKALITQSRLKQGEYFRDAAVCHLVVDKVVQMCSSLPLSSSEEHL